MSFVLLIIAIAGAIGYPIVGRMIDRYGAMPVILTGNVLFAASVASVSLAEASRIQFYSAYALIGITAAIPSSVMFTKVIAGWFDQRRGLFLGIAGGLGNGIGAALSPLFVYALISSYGWRAGFQGIGAAIIRSVFRCCTCCSGTRRKAFPEAQRNTLKRQRGYP